MALDDQQGSEVGGIGVLFRPIVDRQRLVARLGDSGDRVVGRDPGVIGLVTAVVAIFGANHVISTRMSTVRPLPGETKSDGRSARATPQVPSTMSSIQAGEPRNIRIAKAS